MEGVRKILQYLRAGLEEILSGVGDLERLSQIDDIHQLCSTVDERLSMLHIPGDKNKVSEVLEFLPKIRLAIAKALIHEIYEEKRRVLEASGEVGRAQEIVLEEDLAQVAFKLATYKKYSRNNEAILNSEWIQMNHPELYEAIKPLILDPVARSLDWSKLLPFLPKEIRRRAQLQNVTNRPSEAIMAKLREYRHICESIGPEAMADFMVAEDPAMAESFEKVFRIITRYIGPTANRAMGPIDFGELPNIMFEKPDLRKVVQFHLRRYVFRQLVREKGDLGVESGKYQGGLKDIERILEPVLKNKPSHKILLGEVLQYYEEVITMPIPSRLRRKIKPSDDADEEVGFPSLAQRMVAHQMKTSGKPAAACLPMGKGKTSNAFLCKEILGAKKMLFVCTSAGKMMNDLEKQANKHYTEEDKPSIGRIEAGITQENLTKALKAEIVFIPYSMLSSERDEYDQPMIDQLLEAEFDFMTVDEAHLAKNPTTNNAENIRILKEGKKDDKGKIIKEGIGDPTLLLSGTLIPNSPEDILPQLRLYKPELFQDDEGNYSKPSLQALRRWIKRHDPLALRSLLMEFIINPYEPDNWQKYVQSYPVELSPEHQIIYDTILDNPDMTFAEKMYELSLALMHPEDITGYPTENTLQQVVIDFVLQAFEKYGACVLAEPRHRMGVLERRGDVDLPTFVEKVTAAIRKAYGEDPDAEDQSESLLISHVIHGGVRDEVGNDERTRLFNQTNTPPNGRKVLLASMMGIMQEGVNLSGVHRMVQLAPDLREPSSGQLVRRAAREGNEDVSMIIPNVPGTIFEGIQRHARYKFMLIQRMMEGGTLTLDDIRFFQQGETGGGADFIDGRFLVGGTEIGSRVRSRLQILEAYAYYLQTKGRGEVKFSDFLAQRGEMYARFYCEAWEGTQSANNARLSSAIAVKLENNGLIPGNRYADFACGPLAFQNTFGLRRPKAHIENFDLSEEMMEEGVDLLRRRSRNPDMKANCHVSSILNLRMNDQRVSDESFDFVNCGFAFQFLGQSARSNIYASEKVTALLEWNRVLAPGGILQMTLPENACTDQNFEHLTEVMGAFGFEVLTEYTGKAHAGRKQEGPAISRVLVARKKEGEEGKPRVHQLGDIEAKALLKKLKFEFDDKAPSLIAHQRESKFGTVFNLNESELRYIRSETEDDLSPEAREYQERKYNTRLALQKLYKKNGDSFEGFSKRFKRKMMEMGVIVIPTKSKARGKKWSFSFVDDTYAKGRSYYIFDDEDRSR